MERFVLRKLVHCSIVLWKHVDVVEDKTGEVAKLFCLSDSDIHQGGPVERPLVSLLYEEHLVFDNLFYAGLHMEHLVFGQFILCRSIYGTPTW